GNEGKFHMLNEFVFGWKLAGDVLQLAARLAVEFIPARQKTDGASGKPRRKSPAPRLLPGRGIESAGFPSYHLYNSPGIPILAPCPQPPKPIPGSTNSSLYRPRSRSCCAASLPI